ncbi:phage holin family protein [Paracoccus marinaquae]|uniref:Phage holin family protein n=1 Tax=Paracoccus marinaquae TaxID=2841926 RepID=A0ABS6AI54_9RHOB|nr:phage holin family protein [Paracoccus marinaquae]MBU3030286.1 phage holin family protein [Paracoccus marinaquae]
MFDYARKMQLALGDIARRSALKAVAGVVLALGAGFLLAALWSWLANGLGWGAMLASLALGAGLVVIGLVILAVASKTRHPMPDTDELRREVEARVSLAADAAVGRAKTEAMRMASRAETRVETLMGDAARRVRDTARKSGLGDDTIDAARRGAGQAARRVSRAARSDAGGLAGLIGAFALGVALASRLAGGRPPDPAPEDEEDDLS